MGVNNGLTDVIMYTDGGCRGNPGGCGGYGVVLISGKHIREISGFDPNTTNNRMEIMALIVGLKALKRPCNVKVYTDSQYVANTITKGWLQSWVKTGFRGKKNPDLWSEVWELMGYHNLEVNWVRGHNGVKYNERCDELANQAMDNGYGCNIMIS